MSRPTPELDVARQHRHPRWRINMWITCAVVMACTLVLLGMDIGHAGIPPAVADRSRALLVLSILVPGGEWAVRYYTGALRTELAAHDGRVDALAAEIAELHTMVASLHEVMTRMHVEFGERLDTELLRGTQKALDELTGGAVVALPKRVPAARKPANDRHQ